MNKCFWGLFLMPLAFADPFYGEMNEKSTTAFSQIDNHFPCKISSEIHRLQLPTQFEKLQFIGVVIFNEQDKRALFLDEQGHSSRLIELREKDLITQQGIQIEHIDLKAMSYILWQQTNDCENPTRIRLKL